MTQTAHVAHETRGQGSTPVLLVHGFLGSGRNLASLARRWTDANPTLRVILPDLPGHGTSAPLTAGANLTSMAQALLAWANNLGLPRPLRWVGHSLGGRVALAAKLLDAKAVGPITLLDIAPGPVPAEATDFDGLLACLQGAPTTAPRREDMRAYFTDAGVAPALADWVTMNLHYVDDRYAWRIDRDALQAFHNRVNGADLWAAVEQPNAPLRCIRGGRSLFVQEADVQRFARAGCRVDTLATAGHFVHVDAQAELLGLLSPDF